VQTFIYQFVVLSKINRLTSKRFEQKYLWLSGFAFKDVQISPANTLCSIHVWMKRCTVEHLTSNRIQVRRKILSCRIPQFIYESKSEKNYWNRSTFAKVIVKIIVAPFLWPTVYMRCICGCCCCEIQVQYRCSLGPSCFGKDLDRKRWPSSACRCG